MLNCIHMKLHRRIRVFPTLNPQKLGIKANKNMISLSLYYIWDSKRGTYGANKREISKLADIIDDRTSFNKAIDATSLLFLACVNAGRLFWAGSMCIESILKFNRRTTVILIPFPWSKLSRKLPYINSECLVWYRASSTQSARREGGTIRQVTRLPSHE